MQAIYYLDHGALERARKVVEVDSTGGAWDGEEAPSAALKVDGVLSTLFRQASKLSVIQIPLSLERLG